MSKTIVFKIGTSSITAREAGEPVNKEVIDLLASTIAKIKQELDINCVLVSSGAMGLGVHKLGINGEHDIYNEVVDFKAALTSLGQVELMKVYEDAFHKYNEHVGQILITHFGLDHDGRFKQIQKTVRHLLKLGVTPIFNENDPVCPEELEFGDNDALSARIAKLTKAERLIILTDTNGLYNKDPHKHDDAQLIKNVSEITDDIKKIAGGSSTHMGLGGMKSKVMAAEKCLENKIKMNIINKMHVGEVYDYLKGFIDELPGTEFKK